MLLVRYVEGLSMSPVLRPGRLVIARKNPTKLRRGDIVIIRHGGMEKIKRVTRVSRSPELDTDKIYVEGDNKDHSTDSRHFGWLDKRYIQGKVIWPLTATRRDSPISSPM